MKNEIDVQGTPVRFLKVNGTDFICITDIAALKKPIEPKDVIKIGCAVEQRYLF